MQILKALLFLVSYHPRDKPTNEVLYYAAKILELEAQGYNQREIVVKSQIAKGTANSDLAYEDLM